MSYEVSDGHVTDDVTWPRIVQLKIIVYFTFLTEAPTGAIFIEFGIGADIHDVINLAKFFVDW